VRRKLGEFSQNLIKNSRNSSFRVIRVKVFPDLGKAMVKNLRFIDDFRLCDYNVTTHGEERTI
jgi:hypothetical protein